MTDSAENLQLDDDFVSFLDEGLAAHNKYRKSHGVPELRINKELCAYAQEYADASAIKNSIKTRDDPEYGENTYSAKSKNFHSISDAVDTWYSEIKKHKFNTESVNKKSYSFCQLIWRNTFDLGLGMATSPKGKVFVVANYYPKGNRSGEFRNNVPTALSHPSDF